MCVRPYVSGMSFLSGLRASVETFPWWWAFPTSEYYARYDSPDASGGLSLSQYSSASLLRVPRRRSGSGIVPSPGFPLCASIAVYQPPTLSTRRSLWGLPSSSTPLFLHATACGLRRTFPSLPKRMFLCSLRCALKPSASATRSFRSCTSTSGDAAPPTACRILCLRLVHLVRRAHRHDSAMDARLDTGGWLTLTRQGLSPCKRRQAFLGAVTPTLSGGGGPTINL